MSIANDIEDARKRHAPSLHLVEQHVRETAELIAYETGLEHRTERAVSELTVSIVMLMRIVNEGETGRAMVGQSRDELLVQRDRMNLLITALEGRHEI